MNMENNHEDVLCENTAEKPVKTAIKRGFC